MTIVKRHIQQLRRQQRHGEAAMLVMVATGALWPAARRAGLEGERLHPVALDAPAARPLEAERSHPACPEEADPVEEPAPRPTTMEEDAEYDMEQVSAEDSADLEGWDNAWGGDPVTVEPELLDQSEGNSTARLTPPRCPRCGAAEETSFHQLWGCTANRTIPGYRQDLLAEATEHSWEFPCFWLRGLTPLEWVYQHCMMPTQSQPEFRGCSPQAPFQLEPGMVAGTDGSGGPNSADPRVRRCGWGFTLLSPEGTQLAAASGPLDYWKQTVPLAELAAVTALLLCTVGDLTVVIDNAAVVKGIQAGPTHPRVSNRHAWKLLWAAVGDRRLEAIKVKSHLDEPSAADAGVPWLHWRANALADQLADRAALAAQLPSEALEAVRQVDSKARAVQEHLLAVSMAVAKEAGRLYGPSARLERAREARLRGEERRAQLEATLARTAHRWCPTSGRCLACLRAPSRAVPKAAFLETACAGVPHQIHSSHALERHRGLWFCGHCGATGVSRFSAHRGLGAPCHPPTTSGKVMLTRLRAGKLPYGRSAWPDEAAEESLGLELVA
jgi:hypothetical protein